jgi:hypothetical protein
MDVLFCFVCMHVWAKQYWSAVDLVKSDANTRVDDNLVKSDTNTRTDYRLVKSDANTRMHSLPNNAHLSETIN